jgi:hypothetical protein
MSSELVAYIRKQKEWCSRLMSGGDWFAIDPDDAPFRAADRIEALEGEVADSLPWKLFYKDGLDLEQIGERLNISPYSLSPWLYAPLLKQEGHPYESALKASEARAERLRDLLSRLFEEATTCDGWVKHTDSYELVKKELEVYNTTETT